MELTKEYFDEQLGKQLGKFAVNIGLAFEEKFVEQAKLFDNKISAQTKELKAYTDEKTEKLARMIQETIAEPYEKRFTVIEKDIVKIKTVLNLN